MVPEIIRGGGGGGKRPTPGPVNGKKALRRLFNCWVQGLMPMKCSKPDFLFLNPIQAGRGHIVPPLQVFSLLC